MKSHAFSWTALKPQSSYLPLPSAWGYMSVSTQLAECGTSKMEIYIMPCNMGLRTGHIPHFKLTLDWKSKLNFHITPHKMKKKA
jgi:hypothetical protein